MRNLTIGIVGNPNCGKTTLFNALTGAKQRVGNWPGVTVDRKTGTYRHGSTKIDVVDTPGIYSLSAASLDEALTRDYILSGKADLIVNIVDASNIERNLYLTTELLELGLPLVVVLNMSDVAESKGLVIDTETLSRRLGAPVVTAVGSRGRGLDELLATVLAAVGTNGDGAGARLSTQVAFENPRNIIRPRHLHRSTVAQDNNHV